MAVELERDRPQLGFQLQRFAPQLDVGSVTVFGRWNQNGRVLADLSQIVAAHFVAVATLVRLAAGGLMISCRALPNWSTMVMELRSGWTIRTSPLGYTK